MKRTLKLLSLVFVFVLSFTALFACGPKEETNIKDITQDKVTMNVSAFDDKIEIFIDSDEEEAGNAEVSVIAVKAHEYLDLDTISGLSADKIASDNESKVIDTYKLGTEKKFSINRYDGNFDRLYCKYYIAGEGKLLKGPIYATEIQARNDVTPQFNIKSKKGILGENIDRFKDLGCSYATLNLEIESLIYPNEIFDEGEPVEISHPDNAISFDFNGKTFYFNRSRVEHFDREIKKYYDAGAHVTAIIYALNRGADPEVFPEKMTYPYSSKPSGIRPAPVILALNTSNEYGFEYFSAMMEFLASRYSSPTLENGYVANFIIGNEIDYASSYFKISEKQAELDVYMEEYSRLLRLANLAVKKYNDKVSVNMPITQSWATKGYDDILGDVNSYTPKLMVEWLNAKTKLEGDYDWGLAPHCYTYGLVLSEVFLNDTVNGKKIGMSNTYDTAKITFSNIEVLDSFMKQEEMKCNGKVRGIWLTEQGVSSFKDDAKNRNIQAGAIAAVWYKISQIDSIKSFSYYRMFDHEAEIQSQACFGLISERGEEKPSYQVYKYIDTQYSSIVAKDYLEYQSFVDVNGKEQTYKNGGIKSYNDLLDVFGSNWLKGEFDWSKAAPQTADTVYEWEDKIDLSGVIFENAYYLYDGTAKRLEATGMPEGVTVNYSVEPELTQTGSVTILATFYFENEVVGRREATLSVGKMVTNKTVYNYNEKIFVTFDVDGIELSRNAWIGIYKKGAVPGNLTSGEMSYYYFYPNQYSDTYTRTLCLQDYKNPEYNHNGLIAGDYVLYYFDGLQDAYHYFYFIEISVLSEEESSGSIDLSGIKFESKQVAYDGSAKSLTVTGEELPLGVSVEYITNTLVDVGSVNAVAVFKYDGKEIERRYAVLTVLPSDYDLISTDKTEYVQGEAVMVTAYAPLDSEPGSWWVGLYLANEDDYAGTVSIYWYYVKDVNHVSGVAYNIKETNHNATRPEYADLPAGQYKLVLFNTSGYTVEKEVFFEVKEMEISGETGTVDTDKTQYAVGEAINVTATQREGTIYTYVAALLREKDADLLSNAIYSYNVVEGDRNSGDAFDITKGLLNPDKYYLAPLHAGKYKVVLFATLGGVGKAIDGAAVTIQIGSDEEQPTAGTVYTDKTEYEIGEAIYVTAFAPEDSGVKSWWVGVYAIDDTYGEVNSIYYYYIKDERHVSGETYQIQLQDWGDKGESWRVIPAGRYKVVLFNTSGYTEESKVEITVKASADTE